MLYNYVALLLFAALAIFVPTSFLLIAKMLAKREDGNPVKNAPYESGEETIGRSRDIDNEYMPFFMIFVPFEVIIAILLLWAPVAKYMAYSYDIGIIMLGAFATILAFIGYRMVVFKWTK